MIICKFGIDYNWNITFFFFNMHIKKVRDVPIIVNGKHISYQGFI